MEHKCATLKAAQDWASRLSLKTSKLIQIVFATGSLDKSYVEVPKNQFVLSYDQFAVFNYDPGTKCAKLLGSLDWQPWTRYAAVRIYRRSLSHLHVRSSQPPFQTEVRTKNLPLVQFLILL